MQVWLEIMGLMGILLTLAGVHQLWRADEEVFYWVRRFAELFRAALGQKNSQPSSGAENSKSPAPPAENSLHPHPLGTLHLVGSVGLIAIGSFLFLVSIALVVIRSWTGS